jgi:hypothetical protein
MKHLEHFWRWGGSWYETYHDSMHGESSGIAIVQRQTGANESGRMEWHLYLYLVKRLALRSSSSLLDDQSQLNTAFASSHLVLTVTPAALSIAPESAQTS